MTMGRAQTPLVSVILPTHNRAALLDRAIGSVLAQTYRDFEIVVVDDASTDDTQQVIEGFADPRLRYIRHDRNRGAPAARNTGIAAARGDLIAFQDSDDEWHREKLSRQVDAMHECGDETTVLCTGLLRHSGSSNTYVPEPWVSRRQGNILPQLLLGNFVGTPTLLIPRKCLDKVGGFDENLPRFQDWELVLRLAAAYPFRLLDEPLVFSHDTPGNISSDTEAGFAARRYIIEKHHASFARYPGVLASHLYALGDVKCRDGSIAEGRGLLIEAAKARPQRVKLWLAILASYLGVRTYAAFSATLQRLRGEARA